MMIKPTTTEPSDTQLLDGCFPDHCFYTERSCFIVFSCFPCLSVFFHLLMAELHYILWAPLGRECPFVARLRCGDKGVRRSRTLQGRPPDFLGRRAEIRHFLLSPRLETFCRREPTMTKPKNQISMKKGLQPLMTSDYLLLF